MPLPGTLTPLARLLAARIRERGPLTFAEFMAECLYHPDYGYYSTPEAARFADYYTSVDVHPIFGRLLARQLREMWELLGKPQPFLLVEAGAGVGRLAQHILDFSSRELPELFSALEYHAVERSAPRRDAHTTAIGKHISAGRARSSDELPAEIPAGCVFSNELLDAFPVHRVVREGDELREIYVTFEGNRFADQVGRLSTPALTEYFAVQRVELLEGAQAEVGLEACRWIEDVGHRLRRGFVVTIDYGHEARELYDAWHMCGTLLAYRRHRASEDYYAAPGAQDLTAHVNFTALDLWGRCAGLARTGLVPQTQFLLALGRANDFADLYEEGQSESERLRARLQFKTLIHPEGMGETFRVFIQHKAVENPLLTGLQPL